MNKKGMLATIAGILIILISTIFIMYYFIIDYPKAEEYCSHKFNSSIDIRDCVRNIEGNKMCEKINAEFIKVETHFFSSNIYICKKNGEIIRI